MQQPCWKSLSVYRTYYSTVIIASNSKIKLDLIYNRIKGSLQNLLHYTEVKTYPPNSTTKKSKIRRYFNNLKQ